MEQPEAKVLRFKNPLEKMVCHIRIPNISALLSACEDASSGLSYVADEMQSISERFEELSDIFEECSHARFHEGTFFYNGNYVFVFELPRSYSNKLLELGWEPEEVDVVLG